ncbi:hypothetical protein T265_10888 [Opisthorchis viverrini]|uniref:Uncharacterized protein n=1 Tax=Opisthorchis viverrini TaxID=6198 RepID=A0A074Z0P5_OPIVI|nr:hypothetical protein T265_10888 [Opisthorchis viverrini]KER20611.1 hypothetical protein T265_10888 [Opisthorchis viverrini]
MECDSTVDECFVTSRKPIEAAPQKFALIPNCDKCFTGLVVNQMAVNLFAKHCNHIVNTPSSIKVTSSVNGHGVTLVGDGKLAI